MVLKSVRSYMSSNSPWESSVISFVEIKTRPRPSSESITVENFSK